MTTTSENRGQKFRILTLCTGNICRSPIAESLIVRELEIRGLAENVEVSSAGISSEERGNPIDRRAARVLSSHGYDSLPNHVAHQLKSHEVSSYDVIVPMTTQHARVARQFANKEGNSQLLIRMAGSFSSAHVNGGGATFAEEASHVDKREWDVADPWYGDMADFEVCLSELEDAVVNLVDFLEPRLRAL